MNSSAAAAAATSVARTTRRIEKAIRTKAHYAFCCLQDNTVVYT